MEETMNNPNSENNDVELNITPIIDCFTVLITFMLASASFISIGFFEAYTPGPGTDASAVKPDIEAKLKIKKDHSVELSWNGKKNGSFRVENTNIENLSQITKELEKLKTEKMVINQVIISAVDQTTYKELAAAMGAVQKLEIAAVVGDFEE